MMRMINELATREDHDGPDNMMTQAGSKNPKEDHSSQKNVNSFSKITELLFQHCF